MEPLIVASQCVTLGKIVGITQRKGRPIACVARQCKVNRALLKNVQPRGPVAIGRHQRNTTRDFLAVARFRTTSQASASSPPPTKGVYRDVLGDVHCFVCGPALT